MKIFVFDLDGTILNSKGFLKQETIDAVKRAHNNDHIIVIASGRPQSHMLDIVKDLKYVSYIVCNNGAYIVDLKTNELHNNGFVSKEVSLALLDWAKENKAFFTLHTTKNSYVDKYYDEKNTPEFIHGTDYDSSKANGRGVINDKIKHEDITQTSVKHNIDIIEKLFSTFNEKYKDSHSLTIANEHYLDINPLGVSKLEGLKIIGKLIKKDLKDFVAFGDSQNDYEMLKGVGIGYAMGHSIEVIKKIADHVLGNNDSDDISKTIDSLI